MHSISYNRARQGLLADIGLTIGKGVVGVLDNSVALIADAAHSLGDVVSGGVALWGVKLGARPEDEDHPYGHGKLETIATFAISSVVMLTGMGIGTHAVMKLLEMTQNGAPDSVAVPSMMAAATVIASIGVKELLYRNSMAVATKYDSKLMAATAWHHRSDSISSTVAMAGIIGAMMKFPLLDPLAGMAVAGMIVKAGAQIGNDRPS